MLAISNPLRAFGRHRGEVACFSLCLVFPSVLVLGRELSTFGLCHLGIVIGLGLRRIGWFLEQDFAFSCVFEFGLFRRLKTRL